MAKLLTRDVSLSQVPPRAAQKGCAMRRLHAKHKPTLLNFHTFTNIYMYIYISHKKLPHKTLRVHSAKYT